MTVTSPLPPETLRCIYAAQGHDGYIIERYRRRESSVEEVLIEVYFASVSVRRVEDIAEALWGRRLLRPRSAN